MDPDGFDMDSLFSPKHLALRLYNLQKLRGLIRSTSLNWKASSLKTSPIHGSCYFPKVIIFCPQVFSSQILHILSYMVIGPEKVRWISQIIPIVNCHHSQQICTWSSFSHWINSQVFLSVFPKFSKWHSGPLEPRCSFRCWNIYLHNWAIFGLSM